MSTYHVQECHLDSDPVSHDTGGRDTEILMETALARAALYNFLAAAFVNPPTADLLTAAAEMLPDLPLASLDELRLAYTRLLVGPGKGYAPPYASIYLHPASNGKPQLWGAEATAVEAIYRECGLEVAAGQPRVPDHLALELQFMQHLCSREAYARGCSQTEETAVLCELQQVFLCDHLWPWLPHFVGRLSEVQAHPFYLALAEFMLEFIRSELEPYPTQAFPSTMVERNSERRASREGLGEVPE